jgi:predicted aldo/keto reductase-like oxidoreductase
MVRKQRLGRTGLEVTRLGFGGIPIQRISEEEAVSVVKHVIEQGVTLLDTARGYTNSEERIGLALKQTDGQVYISSKSPERTADGILKHLRISLKKLQLDKIDIYSSHNVSSFEQYEKVTAPGGALEGLMRARDEGLIDFPGITSHNLDVLEQAISDDHFDTIMTCYSFLEPKAEEKVIPMAIEKDLGIMTMKNFSGGVIEDAAVALKYAFSCPEVVPIPGVDSIAAADQNWEIFSLPDYSMTDEERARMEAVKEEYGGRFCRRCDYCLPCSEGIYIQTMLGIRSMIKRMGEDAFDRPWIKTAIEKGRACTECGECEPRCPYDLPIPELIKQNLEWVDSQLTGLEK